MKLKTSSLLAISAVATLLFTTSCKKDNKNPNGSGPLSATIGTTAFQPIGGDQGVAAADEGGYVVIAGLGLRGKDTMLLTVYIDDSLGVNKPGDLSYNGTCWVALTKPDLTDVSSQFLTSSYDGHGTLTVTSWDKTNKKIAGNYSGMMYNAISNTDSLAIKGQFNTNYR